MAPQEPQWRIDMAGNVLIACERSQEIAMAFRRLGYSAFSCDIAGSYGGHPEYHIIDDAARVVQGHGVWVTEGGKPICVEQNWDMIIAHPPCTMLTHSSAVAFAKGTHSYIDLLEGARFFLLMLSAPARFVCVENPAPLGAAQLPPYSQIINPYDFGHPFSKRWCLWLRGLPPLLPTHARFLQHKQWLKHCASNSRRRSHTFSGVAAAMAEQWGPLLKV